MVCKSKKYVTIEEGVDFRTIIKTMTEQKQTTKSVIYFLQNNINGRIYVGSAVDYVRRKNEHKKLLKAGIHPNNFLLYDFQKNISKVNNVFSFVIKEFVFDVKILLEREQYYLDKLFDNQVRCYNLAPKAGSVLGAKWSKESKKRHSQKRKGCGNPMWNKFHSEKTRLLMSRCQQKHVEQFSLDGKKLATYGSITSAAQAVGLTRQMIGHCCNGNRKTGKGFVWRFADDKKN